MTLILWKSLSGEKIKNLGERIAELAVAGPRIVHIGTDSQRCRKGRRYVTVVAVIDPGHGGRVFYASEVTERPASLREQLFREAWKSVEVGMELNLILPASVRIVVHLDVNTDATFRSQRYASEMSGLVLAQGFDVKLKPEAWCASSAADRIVKERHVQAA